MLKKPYCQTIAALLCTALFAVALFGLLFHFDNTYTAAPVVKQDGIAAFTAAQLAFYGLLCFSALSLALFSLALWLTARYGLHRDRLFFWFGLLALSFGARVTSPFLRILGAPLTRPLYALEDGMSLLGAYFILRIVVQLCKLERSDWVSRLKWLSVGMSAVGLLFPLCVLPYLPAFTPFYGQLISWYHLLLSLVLLGMSVFGGIRRRCTPWLTIGITWYTGGLLMQVTTSGSFEPFRLGWGDEWGTWLLMLCFAVLMTLRNRTLVQENYHFTQLLQAEVELRSTQLTALVDERQALLSEFLHDLKSPMASVLTYAQAIRRNSILLDEETDASLSVLEEKCGSIADSLREMQEFTLENPFSFHPEVLDLAQLLTLFCQRNRPDVEVSDVDLTLTGVSAPCMIRGDQSQLMRALQNLVFNAVDFMPQGGVITLSLSQQGNIALLRVSDTGSGISPEHLTHLFDRGFTSRASTGGRGLGLYIVRSVITKHSGTVSVQSTPGKGTVFTLAFPMIPLN